MSLPSPYRGITRVDRSEETEFGPKFVYNNNGKAVEEYRPRSSSQGREKNARGKLQDRAAPFAISTSYAPNRRDPSLV